ncbi:MAG: DUF1345 domain-containing protein [Rubrobacteraceae bacterium]
MAKRADKSSALSGAAVRIVRSTFRLTPLGDAVRGWTALIFAIVVGCSYLIASGIENFFLGFLTYLDTFYVLYLVSTWITMYRSSAEDARHWALAQEDDSKWRRFVEAWKGKRVFSGGAGLLTIISFSLLGLGFALVLLPSNDELGNELIRVPLCVVGVVTAWMLLHTSYALYYTHLYYQAQKPGGFEFPGDEEPDPLDFTYFAFTLGTSFAVSDVEVTERRTRRVALFHGVLAFFYNTAILALVINLVLTGAR